LSYLGTLGSDSSSLDMLQNDPEINLNSNNVQIVKKTTFHDFVNYLIYIMSINNISIYITHQSSSTFSIFLDNLCTDSGMSRQDIAVIRRNAQNKAMLDELQIQILGSKSNPTVYFPFDLKLRFENLNRKQSFICESVPYNMSQNLKEYESTPCNMSQNLNKENYSPQHQLETYKACGLHAIENNILAIYKAQG